MKKIVIVLAAIVVIPVIAFCATGKSRKKALTVRHLPNPTNIHTSPRFARNPIPYMWYYRTEVRNNLNKPLKITSFDALSLENGKWVRRNVLGRRLDSKVFARWYTEGARVKDGYNPAPRQPATPTGLVPTSHTFQEPNGLSPR